MKGEYTEEVFVKRFPDMFENIYCGFDLPEGWGPIVMKLCLILEKVNPEVRVAQVKEKFGGLCFYVDHANESGRKEIDLFELMSYNVCQKCGTTEEVERKGDSWIITLCHECRTRWESERIRK